MSSDVAEREEARASGGFRGALVGGKRAAALLLLCVLLVPLAAQEIDRAYRLYESGEWEEAAEVLDSRLQRGLARPGEMALLGMCYLNMGALEKAEEVIGAAAMVAPEHYAVRLAEGNLALKREDFAAAEERFRRAAELRPGQPEALRGAAMAAFALGVRVMQEGDYPASLPPLQRAAEDLRQTGSREERQVLPALIAALRQTGRGDELLAVYRRYLQLAPQSAEARAGLGLLLMERGQTEEALEQLQRAVDRDTEDPEPYLVLARRALRRGEVEESRGLLQEAIGKAVHLYGKYQVQAARTMEQARGEGGSPGSGEAGAGSGGGASGKGRGEEAAAAAEQSRRLRSLKSLAESAERPQRILREALELLPSSYGSREALLEDLRRLSRWYPSAAEVRAALAAELDAAGLHGEARRQWRELIRRAAFYHEAHLGLGSSYLREGKERLALRSFRRALDLAPEDPEVYRRLRRFFRDRGGREEYRRLLEEQLLKESYEPRLLEEAAAAAEETGDPAAAERYRLRAAEVREYRRRKAAEEASAR